MSATESVRRVVITGLGVVSPLGNSPAAMWQELAAGRSGVGPLVHLPPLAGHVAYAGEARDFTGDIGDFGELSKDRKKAIRKALKMMCRETMMAVSAAQQAAVDGGFGEENMDPERSGVVFGSDYMLSPPEDFLAGMNACGAAEGTFRLEDWGQKGLAEMNPLWMLKYLPNMPASHIAIFNDLRGPNNSLTMREIAGLTAIREAAQTIARGHADRMLAGATGTRVHSFKTVHAVQTEQLADASLDPAAACAPFDANRTGMVVGEGAGAVLLEEREAALARGAKIYGEVLGTGCSAAVDAELSPRRVESLATAARTALAESSLTVQELGHVSAHGLGTSECDAEEAQALTAVLNGTAGKIPTAAAKSYFGNLGAGSGVVELVASLLALENGELYKTLNYETADAACPLAVTRGGENAGASFLKLAVTPQGQAAAVVVGR